MPTKNPANNPVKRFQAAAKEWIKLKSQKNAIETRQELLKPILETHLTERPEKTDEFDGWKFSLVHVTRESFSLSKAREKIDGRILAPYISESAFSQIRTTWQGEAQKEVA